MRNCIICRQKRIRREHSMEDEAELTALGEYCSNGIKKYIFPVHGLEDKIFLALTVKAGSSDESENQAGIAHFLEHVQMTFFNANEMEFLCSAHTDFYATTYYFDCTKSSFEQTVTIIQQIILGTYIEEADIDSIRQDVTAEYRHYYKKNATADFRWLLSNTEYEMHYSIGRLECIKNFNKCDLKKFYERKYCLDEMGLFLIASPEILDEVGDSWIEKLKGLRGHTGRNILSYDKKGKTIYKLGNDSITDTSYYFYRERKQGQEPLDEILLMIAEQLLRKKIDTAQMNKIYLSPTQEFIKISVNKCQSWITIYQLLKAMEISEIEKMYKETINAEPVGYNCNTLRERLIQGFVFEDTSLICESTESKVQEVWEKVLEVCEKEPIIIFK